MTKRKKQLNATNEVEMDMLEADMYESSTEIEIKDFEEFEVIEVDEITEENVPACIQEEVGYELEYDFSKNELDLEDELDWDFDINNNSNDVEEEVENTQSSEFKTDNPENATFNVEGLVAAVSNKYSRIPNAGGFSVINSPGKSTRVSISRKIMNNIGTPNSVQIGFFDKGIVIGEYLGNEHATYDLKKQGAMKIIYNKDLVEQITDYYALDFSNRTSITFNESTYQKFKGNIVAIVAVK